MRSSSAVLLTAIFLPLLSPSVFATDTPDVDPASLAVNDVNPLALSQITRNGKKYACKCYPGEACYPSAKAWSAFNASVNGNLQNALPPGAACYNTLDGIRTFNSAACATVQANFYDEQWNTDHPISNLWNFWTNDTCLPFPPSPSATCTRGFYGTHVVLAHTPHHIRTTLAFARQNNLRLVIRNTGHDFMGRSTGFGALVLNTHSFKDVVFVKRYGGPGAYRGGAVTVGAGVQGRELYRLAHAQSPPVVFVGGECPTVGFAGGYIQGGGHGPLATFYGMAADQVLAFEVITASGTILTLNAHSHPDLFWALKGGGPSTFAALLTVTVKTFPSPPTAALIFNLNDTHTQDPALFWTGVGIFHSLANRWVEHGLFVYYELGVGMRLHVQPFVGPNMTARQLEAIVQPMFDQLDHAGVPYTTTTKEYKTFYEMYIDVFEDERANGPAIIGGRMYTRRDIARNASSINEAQRYAVEQGAFLVGHVVGPGTGAPSAGESAVNPKWREAASFTIVSVGVEGNATLARKREVQELVTGDIGRRLREASPNGAAYVNEGDLEEPNWQEAYWGPNYKKLYLLKKIWDPLGVFYARTTPGTEDWDILDVGTRLCKKLF